MEIKRSLFIIGIGLSLFSNTFATLTLPDTLTVLGIRIEFQKDDANTTTGDGKFDLSSPSETFQIDPPPHNRAYFEDHLTFLKNYFLKASMGQLHIKGDIFPLSSEAAYPLSKAMTFYNPNTTPEANNSGLATLFFDALKAADEDQAIDFSRYQSLIIFHAGVGKDIELGFDETPQDIPSLFITSDFLSRFLGQPSVTVDDTVEIKSGLILPETESQNGLQLGLNGILVSNFGSQLGFPDLFSPDTRRPGIGKFGLMDVGLFNGDGLLPALPCAWTRIYAGWDSPTNIYYAIQDKFDLFYPLSYNSPRIYRVPINENEYFLIENRYSGKESLDSLQLVLSEGRSTYPSMKEVLLTYYSDEVTFSDSTGVLIDVKNPDLGLSGNGALIWHIDQTIIQEKLLFNRINADPKNRGIDLEEADGSQDIGQEFDFLDAGYGSENGWLLDMWFLGNSAPLFKNQFNSTSTPNSQSNYNQANSHISITNFSYPDSAITFNISLNIFQQNFPRQINPDIYGKVISLKTTDLTFDGKSELIFLTDSGKILAVNNSGTSIWGSDSLEIYDFNTTLVGPPLLFDFPNGSVSHYKGLLVLTKNGLAHLLQFNNNNVNSFFDFECGSEITTHPTAKLLSDSTIQVFWGCQNGEIYTMTIAASGITVEEFFKLNFSIKYLHLNKMGELLSIDDGGNVYLNQTLVAQNLFLSFPPVGDFGTGITNDGKIFAFDPEVSSFTQINFSDFNSPLVLFPVKSMGELTFLYFTAGNNFLYSFNYNFTSFENFPVQIFHPQKETNFFYPPLISNFIENSFNESYGIILSDPGGYFDGFNLKGERLENFPLVTGDSLSAPPVLLDIDGDKDVELATVTQNGQIYIWDLSAQYLKRGWNQLYYDEFNSNRVLNPEILIAPEVRNDINVDQLLPENKVYNWPNPNTDNYTYIRYFLTERAEVTIKIYDLAGDLVEQFSGEGNPFTDNEILWDLSEIQSGVYLARIEAQSHNKNETKTIKIAVIK